jgi:FkbM family methyltransferase
MPPRDLTPEFWRELAQQIPPDAVILDLGSHHLEEAQLLIPHLVRPRWHGFEANTSLCQYNRDFIIPILENAYDCTVRLTNIAIDRRVGEAKLHLSSKKNGESWTMSSSIRSPKKALTIYPWLAFERSTIVKTTTLDDYCGKNTIAGVDLVKMDIQGAEIDAVLGGQLTFATTKYLITEVVKYEEYEGQVGLQELLDALPGHWSIVEKLMTDALLVNNDWMKQ